MQTARYISIVHDAHHGRTLVYDLGSWAKDVADEILVETAREAIGEGMGFEWGFGIFRVSEEGMKFITKYNSVEVLDYGTSAEIYCN